MKIALPSNQNKVDAHFGHCEYFTVFTANENNEIINEEKVTSPAGCGCKSNIVSTLSQMGVNIMLAGNMGDGAVYTNRTSPTQSHQYTSYASCGTPPVPAAGCAYTINLIVYDDGTPSAPGYSCVLNLCTGYLTDLDDVKVTVN